MTSRPDRPAAKHQPKTAMGEVRAFLARNLAAWRAGKPSSKNGRNPAFSKKMAEQGWIGMTWPKKYGGHERSALERYVVLEEMLAAGAGRRALIADRQSGPSILRFAQEEQKNPRCRKSPRANASSASA